MQNEEMHCVPGYLLWRLMEYSVIQQHLFISWIRGYKGKNLFFKISADSNFAFSSYAWLFLFYCFHRLLCCIKSRVQDFLWKLLSFQTEMISAQFLWKSVPLRRATKICKKFKFWQFWERPLFNIREYAFNMIKLRVPQRQVRQTS